MIPRDFDHHKIPFKTARPKGTPVGFQGGVLPIQDEVKTTMPPRETFHALLLEKDLSVVEAVRATLRERAYGVTVLSDKKEGMKHLLEKAYPIAIVGNVEGFNSVFDAMKEMVMASPTTSLILLTDRHEKEIHEKSEGYGILGHIPRSVPRSALKELLDRFEAIAKAIPRGGKSHKSTLP
jgi:response regulator RpfG family c-di-GMP phosphodiesterase